MEDLFENPQTLPQHIQTIVYDFGEEGYKECEAMLEKLKPLGYTFEYGLDGIPYNLRKIK